MAKKKPKALAPIFTSAGMKKWLKARDKAMLDPSVKNALAHAKVCAELGAPCPVDLTNPVVLLGGIHKARVLWEQSTEEMVAESTAWLKANDLLVPIRPVPRRFHQ